MSILQTIVETKQLEVQSLPTGRVTVDRLRGAIAQRGGLRPFRTALQKARPYPLGLIAEIKKASPSAGVIRPDFDPVAIARDYAEGGADCLSVLTDQRFFQGSLDYLRAVRQAVELPLLRKDFIIDERQILEAVEAGADAILLLVSLLTAEQLHHFHSLAHQAGLAALVEVHDLAELNRALAIRATLIGVNNRDLKTFTVDLATTEYLADHLRQAGRLSPPDPLMLVAESGIRTRPDVERLEAAGVHAMLIGESLMRPGQEVKSRIRELLAPDRQV